MAWTDSNQEGTGAGWELNPSHFPTPRCSPPTLHVVSVLLACSSPSPSEHGRSELIISLLGDHLFRRPCMQLRAVQPERCRVATHHSWRDVADRPTASNPLLPSPMSMIPSLAHLIRFQVSGRSAPLATPRRRWAEPGRRWAHVSSREGYNRGCLHWLCSPGWVWY